MNRSNARSQAVKPGGTKLSQRYWFLLAEGVCALVFGILAIAWPGLTFFLFLTIFGIYALVDGGLLLLHGLTGWGRAKTTARVNARAGAKSGWGHWLLLIEGAVGVVAGILCIILPHTPNRALLFIIAAWLVVKGIGFLLQAASRSWLTGIAGVLAIAAGIYLFVEPKSAFRNILLVIGIYALIMGAVLVFRGVKAKMAQTSPQVAGERAPSL
jgi:uncharacterized membrane protein HdeD (DUF308 family)